MLEKLARYVYSEYKELRPCSLKSKGIFVVKEINPYKLICMDNIAKRYNYRVDLAYARSDNFLFGEQIYHHDAKLWLYEDLAHIVCMAAQECFAKEGMRFILYDGLRTVEAQKAMMQTRRAKKNKHWMEPPRLLSVPGSGGHPRGMAVDIGLEEENGKIIDMGCPFDFLADNPDPQHNPAHRNYNHSKEIRAHRAILDEAILGAAKVLGTEITPLPEEWWDFRLPRDIYGGYKPLSEQDLPNHMKMMK